MGSLFMQMASILAYSSEPLRSLFNEELAQSQGI